jgi:hypothetical protein
MKGLLKLLGSECWGSHDWIYKANNRGLWLECRRCGHESPGLELPAPGYHRTQEGIEDAHRLGAARPGPSPVPAQAVPPTAPPATPPSWRFAERRAAARPPAISVDEQRWLDLWRSLSPEAREMAERMMTSLVARDAALRARDAASIAHAS